ncbi:MAG: hypothetical protein IKN52_08275 [Victivallales bacterium]|nr:hypothetical protein [Victivallales bacterium]
MSKDSPTNTAELRRALQSKQKKIDVKELEELAADATSADIVDMVNKIVRALKK